MKAILVNPDKSLSWSDVPNPVMGEEDCLVEIHCAALNRADAEDVALTSTRRVYVFLGFFRRAIETSGGIVI